MGHPRRLLRRRGAPDGHRGPGGGPDDPDHVVTLNAYYHATVGAAVGDPDPHETAEIGWFAPDELPDIAFDHARQVLAAWRDAVREKRTVTPLPDRP